MENGISFGKYISEFKTCDKGKNKHIAYFSITQ